MSHEVPPRLLLSHVRGVPRLEGLRGGRGGRFGSGCSRRGEEQMWRQGPTSTPQLVVVVVGESGRVFLDSGGYGQRPVLVECRQSSETTQSTSSCQGLMRALTQDFIRVILSHWIDLRSGEPLVGWLVGALGPDVGAAIHLRAYEMLQGCERGAGSEWRVS